MSGMLETQKLVAALKAAAAEKGQDSEKAAETAEAKGDRKGRAKTAKASREGRTPLAAPDFIGVATACALRTVFWPMGKSRSMMIAG